jgi:hypothetical protein
MKNARIEGDFQSVSGGDLYVYVFDDLNFRNWKAGGDSKSLYNSGKAVVGKLDTRVSSTGQYHLVFSNRHSWITKKVVRTDIDLSYEVR